MFRVRRGAIVGVAAVFAIMAFAGLSTASADKTFAPKDCSKPKVKPTRMVLSCGDFGSFVRAKHWSLWGHKTARGRGFLRANDCSPSCAEGTFQRYHVRFRLGHVRHRKCGGRRVDLFRKIHLRFDHRKPPYAHRIRDSRLFCNP